MYIPCEASSWTLLHQNRKLSSRISLQNQLFCLCRLPAVLGGKHAGMWLMGKNHKHYWRHSIRQYVTNEDLYPNIYAIFTVLITMPVSSASSERSFSAMRRVKNCLRATMGDEILSNLSLLHIHKARNLNLEDVINTFTVRKNRRLDFI